MVRVKENPRDLAWHKTYLSIAKTISLMSHAERRKVGSVLVKRQSIISYGYNGLPAGMDNACEIDNVTRPEVLHAETNAIMKVAKSTLTTRESILYVTLSPCLNCAKLIAQADIKLVVYSEQYRCTEGIEFLKNLEIPTLFIDMSKE